MFARYLELQAVLFGFDVFMSDIYKNSKRSSSAVFAFLRLGENGKRRRGFSSFFEFSF